MYENFLKIFWNIYMGGLLKSVKKKLRRTIVCNCIDLELFGTVTVLFLIAVGQWRHHTNHPSLASLYKLLQGLSHQVSSYMVMAALAWRAYVYAKCITATEKNCFCTSVARSLVWLDLSRFLITFRVMSAITTRDRSERLHSLGIVRNMNCVGCHQPTKIPDLVTITNNSIVNRI